MKLKICSCVAVVTAGASTALQLAETSLWVANSELFKRSDSRLFGLIDGIRRKLNRIGLLDS